MAVLSGDKFEAKKPTKPADENIHPFSTFLKPACVFLEVPSNRSLSLKNMQHASKDTIHTKLCL